MVKSSSFLGNLISGQHFFQDSHCNEIKDGHIKIYSISRKLTFYFSEILFLILLNGNLQRDVDFTNVY